MNYIVLMMKHKKSTYFWTGKLWSKQFMYGKRITFGEYDGESTEARVNGNWVLDAKHIKYTLATPQLPHSHDVNYIYDEEQGE